MNSGINVVIIYWVNITEVDLLLNTMIQWMQKGKEECRLMFVERGSRGNFMVSYLSHFRLNLTKVSPKIETSRIEQVE